ncbi:MAG: tRNA pseudouridine(55) synthase TruB [Burkholderiales bacterium]
MKTQRVRIQRRPVHGVLLLDKPVGLSSNDALQKAKWLLRAEKAGHTGTLDPLASGLLPLCFGAATKFSQVSLDADKRYTATLRLGQTTTTGDAEGELLLERPVTHSAERLGQILAGFLGPIAQVPPMYSALKHEGKALYAYARAGVTIEREARQVTIHALNLVESAGDRLVLDVVCSKGTYVRTLAEDIGEALGCGAHLSALRRTGSGPLDVAQAVPLATLTEMEEARREALLLPPDALLQEWPAVRLPADEAGKFLSGMRRRIKLADAPQVRVYGPSQEDRTVKDLPDDDLGALHDVLLGSAHVQAGELIADRLLSPPEVAALIALTQRSEACMPVPQNESNRVSS